MQQFLIDVDKPTGLLVIYAKQADSMSRFFSVSLFSGGAEWDPPRRQRADRAFRRSRYACRVV